MSAKKKRFNTRTILIILFVIVIIGAGYILITNLPVEEDTLSPEEVLRNKDKYLNESIVVKGYFDLDGNDPVVASTMSTVTGRELLEIDYSGVDNASDILITGTKYKFTGVLTLDEDNPIVDAVIFVIEKIEEV